MKILRNKYWFLLLVLPLVALLFQAQKVNKQKGIKIAKIKYAGGGDWYANRTALPNLIKFCNANLKTNIVANEDIVEIGSKDIFNYPFVYLTGHGNVLFSDDDATNLRNYLISGGFLHIDDNYGLDIFIRPQMKKVFPEINFVELPWNHAIYHQTYQFSKGLPKIHKHDNKPAKGYGLIYKGQLVCYYSLESDLGNGWEDTETYNDPEELRQKALKMGANIIEYSFAH